MRHKGHFYIDIYSGQRLFLLGVLLFIISLVLWTCTNVRINSVLKTQRETETQIAFLLHKMTNVIEGVERRQTSVEHILSQNDELRLTINEIEAYNKKHMLPEWPRASRKRAPKGKNIAIGGP